jgi:hypothetical protein
VRKQPEVPWYRWPVWFLLLGAGLFVFYIVFTPIWMGIRLISWLAERRNLTNEPWSAGGAEPGSARQSPPAKTSRKK